MAQLPLDFSRLLTGRVIQVIAGENRETLIIHEPILSTSESPQLRALVTGTWKESEGVIDWSETDVETVKRVLAYLYTRDYVSPDPEIINTFQSAHLPASENCSQTNEEAIADDAIDEQEEYPEDRPLEPLSADISIQKAILGSIQLRPLTPVRRCLPQGVPTNSIPTAAGVYANAGFSSTERHFGEVLLAHGRVYAFARVHLITGLETLALQRLTQVLLSLDTSHAHVVSDVVQLIRYVYDCDELDDSDEPIRKLTTQFAAINFTDLKGDDFEMLLSEGGAFMVELTRRISRRLLSSATCSGVLERQIEDLEKENGKLNQTVVGRDATIARLSSENAEWQSWKRGISSRAKGKKWC